jgi:hypothetical protein
MLAKKHEQVFRKDFIGWLYENVHVFKVFESLAEALAARGRTYYSARTIIEKMRFDHDVSEVNTAFKISNNMAPDIVRLYVLTRPRRVNMFSYMKTSKREDFKQYIDDLLTNEGSGDGI